MEKREIFGNQSGITGFLSLLCGLTSVLFSLSFWLGAGTVIMTSFTIPFSILGIALARASLKKGPNPVATAGLTASVFGLLLNIAAFVMFLIYFK